MDALPLSPCSSSPPPPPPLPPLTMDDASQGKAKEIVGKGEEEEEEEEEASASASVVAVEEEEGERRKRQFRKKSFVRADLVNLADLDAALADWHLKRGGGGGGVGGVLSKVEEGGGSNRKEEWEIDTSKLVVKDRLATGTFGTVYRGIFQGQDVAVKLLDWGDESSRTRAEIEALRNSFQQEVAVWHKLDHLNVTRFVGASMGGSAIRIPSKGKEFDFLPVASKVCCVVVEYLPGGTLKSFLIRHRRRKLAFKVVMQIALDLSRGLSYLHSKNIVHRDVKTENMLLDINMRVKIADFGVARVEAQNPQDMTGETGTLGYMAPECFFSRRDWGDGTLGYMAPEVFRGEAYDRTCDVYSFGICLWETYCCDMPYADLSFAEMTSAVVNKNLRPTIPKCCPSSLASVMKKCWDANPKNRPDMDKVVQMLEAIDTTKGGGMIPPDQPQGCLCFLRYRGP